MTKSKLQLCIAILQALNREDPLTDEMIAASVSVNRKRLSRCLLILSEQNMVKQIEQQNSTAYMITEAGKKVLNFFKLANIVECERITNLRK